MNNKSEPAICMDAIFFTVKILSFDAVTICEANISGSKDYGSRFDPLRTMTPEEAEAFGIDLFAIKDIGATADISLGEELRDWRTFQSADKSRITQLSDGYLWLQDKNQAVWMNPKIKADLDTLGLFHPKQVSTSQSVPIKNKGM